MHGDRAERLRVLLSVGPWASDPERAIGELPPEDLHVLGELEKDDLMLASACYEVEVELRDRGCAAVSELADMIGSSPGSDLGERVLALPEPEVFRAIGCVLDLGWID